MSYAIFRSEPIQTLSDLSEIGAHNKRSKKAYNSNPDIKVELSKDNIEIVPCKLKYVAKFDEITKDYRLEHEKRMETMRENRKKTFHQAVNDSNGVVADELLFTSDNDFFKNMNREEIIRWANTCMEFVYEDMGYTKDQVLHATVHMDEKTPHMHCVVVPLVKKYDKRTETERYTISKKQYIKDKEHLSKLQDKYHERLNSKGFNLDRGIKNSDVEHINIKEYKKITRKLNQELNIKNERLNQTMEELNNKMQSNKATLFDKEYVKVKKDTFDTMNKAIKETKKVIEMQPKIEQLYHEVDTYVTSYQSLEKENKNIKKEVANLQKRNENLRSQNNFLTDYIHTLIEIIKEFFRKLLKQDNEKIKDITADKVKEHYDDSIFQKEDVIDVAKDTTKEKELFDYAGIEYYHAKRKDKDDFEISI